METVHAGEPVCDADSACSVRLHRVDMHFLTGCTNECRQHGIVRELLGQAQPRGRGTHHITPLTLTHIPTSRGRPLCASGSRIMPLRRRKICSRLYSAQISGEISNQSAHTLPSFSQCSGQARAQLAHVWQSSCGYGQGEGSTDKANSSIGSCSRGSHLSPSAV